MNIFWQQDLFSDEERDIAFKYFNPVNSIGDADLSRCATHHMPDSCKISQYLPNLGKYFYSKNYFLIDSNNVLQHFSEHDELFIKSDSGKKIISGQVYTKERWLEELSYLRQRNSEEILVFVSLPVKIKKEYRHLFVGEMLSDSCQYMEDCELCASKETSDVAIALAKEIRKNSYFYPEQLVAIDIGVDESGQAGLIEINNLENSGFYAVDFDKVYSDLFKYCQDLSTI